MRRWVFLFLFFTTAGVLFSNEKPSLITVGGGCWDVMRSRHQTGEFLVEYKSNLEWYWIRPMIGLIGNNKGGFYTYGGFNIDCVIANRLVIAPSFAVGFYQRGNGKKLGFPLEFRSGLELSWQFKNNVRFGGIFYHISNASLGSRNPGTESLDFFLSIPLQFPSDKKSTDSRKDTSN